MFWLALDYLSVLTSLVVVAAQILNYPTNLNSKIPTWLQPLHTSTEYCIAHNDRHGQSRQVEPSNLFIVSPKLLSPDCPVPVAHHVDHRGQGKYPRTALPSIVAGYKYRDSLC